MAIIDLSFSQHSGKLVPVSVIKTHKLLTDKHSVSHLSMFYGPVEISIVVAEVSEYSKLSFFRVFNAAVNH